MLLNTCKTIIHPQGMWGFIEEEERKISLTNQYYRSRRPVVKYCTIKASAMPFRCLPRFVVFWDQDKPIKTPL